MTADDQNERASDPRNRRNDEYETMPGSLLDSSQNLPGDQPEDDTPPPAQRAKETDGGDSGDS